MTIEETAGLISPEDRVALDDLIARYCWAFDGGDADAYVALWAEGGSFSGFGPTVSGEEGLRGLVTGTYAQTGGTWSHHFSNGLFRYGSDRDHVSARAYVTVTRRGDPAAVQMAIKGRYEFVRIAGAWGIAAVEVQLEG